MENFIRQYDKRNGKTYCYTQENVVDPETGKLKKKRHCIGRWDEQTQSIIPTGNRGRPRKNITSAVDSNMNLDYKQMYLDAMETIKEKDKTIERLKAQVISYAEAQQQDFASIEKLYQGAQSRLSRFEILGR